METSLKSGFIGIVGPTNSGKSTLLNALVGEKISIVSPKVQTTYHRVCGVVHGQGEQFVFVDTPGYQRHPESVARLLNRVADRGAQDCDLYVWVFDASQPRFLADIEQMADKIKQWRTADRRLCLLNKVDKVKDKSVLLPALQRLAALELFHQVIPISALRKDGIDRLLGWVRENLGEGPKFFEEDQVTDRSERFLVSELIRERVYRETGQEVPYSVWVEIERWEDPTTKVGKVPVIHAAIHVDSSSRKRILVGRAGRLVKEIGMGARAEIEKLLGYQICLKLFIDVQEGWKQDKAQVAQYLELNQ